MKANAFKSVINTGAKEKKAVVLAANYAYVVSSFNDYQVYLLPQSLNPFLFIISDFPNEWIYAIK